jgi:60 kDa SS-A/Ro ribonucleoprotein
VRLRDLLFLCHAKPTDERQAATWRALVEGTLPPPDTWEVALSRGADRRETWMRLIAERKLGGLAMLRNLRNMGEAGVPGDVIREGLTQARYDRVLPFRFVAAAKATPQFEPELEGLMLAALADAPKLAGKTILLVDHSGSMRARLSRRSALTRYEAGAALAILLREVCERVEIVNFSTEPWLVPPRRGFPLRDALVGGEWGATHTDTAKRMADDLGYDRLVIVTDEQSHEVLSKPKGRGYVINVGSYRNGVGYGAWTHIDGWSEAVVRYIAEVGR